MTDIIPVILFAYARPVHLARVLECLRENRVPLIYAFADGAKGPMDADRVGEARALLRAVDWCDLRLVERADNLGLGHNVLLGVTEIAERHEAFIVWEDDLVCVPGTYAWMCAALRHYASDTRVMSVAAWTHVRVTPDSADRKAYFDGRACSWVWGAWQRSWLGMNDGDALEKMRLARRRGVRETAYGFDLPPHARMERSKNIWAVRWLYHHMAAGGLCLRPPCSMVEHIGFDSLATNAADGAFWSGELMGIAVEPESWPVPVENPCCRALWRKATVGEIGAFRLILRAWRFCTHF